MKMVLNLKNKVDTYCLKADEVLKKNIQYSDEKLHTLNFELVIGLYKEQDERTKGDSHTKREARVTR
jgi:hypothetical protein